MIDTSLPANVELLCITYRAPLLLQGVLQENSNEDKSWRFISDNPVLVNVEGFRAIVNFKNSSLPMLTLRIKKHQEAELTLEPTNIHPREQRLFPRLYGLINLAFKAEPSAEEVPAWLNGNLSKDESWITPTPLMNFSVNGASFTSPTAVPENATLLIQLNFETEMRGIGRVIRCSQEDEQYEIAVYFETIPDEAITHLTQLTLQIQDSLF